MPQRDDYTSTLKRDLVADLKARALAFSRKRKDEVIAVLRSLDEHSRAGKETRGRDLQYSEEEMCDALEGAFGIPAIAAAALGCSRPTIYAYIERYQSVRDAWQTSKETTKDIAEGKLFALFTDKAWKEHKDYFPALRFYLRTIARDRGYGDRVRYDVIDESKMEAFVNELSKIIDESDFTPEQKRKLAEQFRDASLRLLPR